MIAGLLLLLHMVSAYAWAKGDFWFLEEWRLITHYGHVEPLDLDAEQGFGTWFSAVILLISGRLLLLISRDSRQARDGLGTWWMGLAVGFHVLSIDEVAGMHEYVNRYGEQFGWGDRNWTTYGAVVALAVAAAYLPFLFKLFRRGNGRAASLMILAGVLYLGGAVVVETISPEEKEMLSTLVYNLGWITLEEGLEMAGIILFIHTLLDHLRGGATEGITVEIGTTTAPPP